MSEPSTPTTPGGDTNFQRTIDDAREATEALADLAAFIERGLCHGLVMIALPVFTTMQHLYTRLNGVAYKLSVALTPAFVFLPRKNTTFDVSKAIEVMGQLAAFLDKSADSLRHHELADGAEKELAKDLRLAMRYTKMLLEATPDRFTDDTQADPAAAESSQDQANEEAAEPKPAFGHESDIAKTLTEGPATTAEQGSQTEPEDRVHFWAPAQFDFRVRPSSSSPEPKRKVIFADDQPQIPERASSIGKTTISQPESQPPPPLPLRNVVSSGSSRPAITPSPSELRPSTHNAIHPPHVLEGRRLESRSGVSDDQEYAELCSFPHKVLSSVPHLHTTVQIGHSDAAVHQQHHQYIDASILGFDGVHFIKLVHPFCGREIRMIGYDTLRYIDTVLKERMDNALARLESLSVQQAKNARRMEQRSREIVQRELGFRAWEMNRDNGNGKPAYVANYEYALEFGEQEPTSSVSEEVEATTADVRSDTYDPPSTRSLAPEDSGTPPPEDPSRLLQICVPNMNTGEAFDSNTHFQTNPLEAETSSPEVTAPLEPFSAHEAIQSAEEPNPPSDITATVEPTSPRKTTTLAKANRSAPVDTDSDDSIPRPASLYHSSTSDGSSQHRTPKETAGFKAQDLKFVNPLEERDELYKAAPNPNVLQDLPEVSGNEKPKIQAQDHPFDLSHKEHELYEEDRLETASNAPSQTSYRSAERECELCRLEREAGLQPRTGVVRQVPVQVNGITEPSLRSSRGRGRIERGSGFDEVPGGDV